jgi:CheY-like chemotaxis protein
MAPEVVERAFEPFFTTKPLGMGTGLGLSMIYGFAKQSGGKTQIQSEVGKGTRVSLYLPRYLGQDPVDQTVAGLPVAVRTKGGRTVLVVDDEPTVRMLIAEVLSELGHTTIEAGEAAQGLRILESNGRVDLLISDVGLPGGMNGRQLADAGRALRPGLRVLFITGYAEHAAIGQGQLEPDMHVVTKPFLIDDLSRRVSEILRQA